MRWSVPVNQCGGTKTISISRVCLWLRWSFIRFPNYHLPLFGGALAAELPPPVTCGRCLLPKLTTLDFRCFPE